MGYFQEVRPFPPSSTGLQVFSLYFISLNIHWTKMWLILQVDPSRSFTSLSQHFTESTNHFHHLAWRLFFSHISATFWYSKHQIQEWNVENNRWNLIKIFYFRVEWNMKIDKERWRIIDKQKYFWCGMRNEYCIAKFHQECKNLVVFILNRLLVFAPFWF